MNITEANAVNRVLSYLTGRHANPWPGQTLPTDAEALEAAALLADKANKALMAGWDGDRVRAAWPEPFHVIDLRADGFTIKHPISCRPHLFDCPFNEAGRALDGPPAPLGRYRVDLDDAGALKIGEAVDG